MSQLIPTRTTRPLQITVAICSLVFTVGSALHGFVIVDTELIETMMRLAGAANPAAEAPGFTTGFRVVGTVYVIGNAVGMLAWVSRSRVLWWWIIAVNATQGLGYVMIPGEMWKAVLDRYGPVGTLPSLVTDGGGALLALLMLATLVKYRTTWARHASAAVEPPG